ncbi:MAG: sugar ABC transporter permease [Spirochaetia bacterium]|nr:sugar ABC transporter permease [Spirochaetota bacterium]MDW8112464.1 sugar ABC transporter permease [Spirochaetia bacterium]
MDKLARKIKREKKIKEFLTAFAFLTPNFFGFLLITAFPVVAVFFLALAKWDGISYPSNAKGTVSFFLSSPAQEDIYIPKGTVIESEVDLTKRFSAKVDKNILQSTTYKLPKINETTVIPITVRGREDYIYTFPANYEFTVEFVVRYDDGSGNLVATNTIVKFFNESEFEVAVGSSIEVYGKIKEVVSGVYKEGIIVDVENISVRASYSKKIRFVGITEEGVSIPKGSTNAQYPVKVSSVKNGEEFNLQEGTLLIPINDLPFKGIRGIVDTSFIGGKTGIQFVGLDNFRTLFTKDRDFWRYFLNTLIFMLQIPLGMAFAIILALALNQKLKGITFFRTLYFLPYISNLVAVAMLWRWIYNDQGLLNELLKSIGVINPPSWLGDGNWAKVAIIVMDVWKNVGYTMLVYLASLQQIPSFLYEAADIDGANEVQKFAYITWPMLAPTNFFIIIIGVINGFQAFGSQYVLTGGGPAGATKTIVYYIYNNAFQWFQMGYAATLSVFLFIVMMIFTIIQWRMGRESTTSSW